jgi:hypothetical protein
MTMLFPYPNVGVAVIHEESDNDARHTPEQLTKRVSVLPEIGTVSTGFK